MNTNLVNQVNVHTRRKRLIAVFFAIFFIMSVTTCVPVYAVSEDIIIKQMQSEFFKGVDSFYEIFTGVVRPIATVLLAFYLLGCLLGTQKEIEKNLGKIKFLAVALAATWILPAVIKAALAAAEPGGGGLPMTITPTPTPSA